METEKKWKIQFLDVLGGKNPLSVSDLADIQSAKLFIHILVTC